MPENVAELSPEERQARIERMRLETMEMTTELNHRSAMRALKDFDKPVGPDWWIAPMALSSMFMGAGIVAVGILIGRLWK